MTVTTWRRAMHAFALLAACAALTACTRAEPEPRQSEGIIPEERVSTDDALPREFPDDIPLPDHTVLYSAVGPFGVSAYFDSPDPASSLRSFFFDRMRAGGWRLASCQVLPSEPEPYTIMNLAKDARVATVLVGYSEDHATRIEGKRFSFLVSVTDDARIPDGTVEPC